MSVWYWILLVCSIVSSFWLGKVYSRRRYDRLLESIIVSMYSLLDEKDDPERVQKAQDYLELLLKCK